jgi:hypothetical protein
LESKEQVLDARFLLLNEKVQSGQTLDLNVFSVLVGERVISDSIQLALQRDRTSSVPRSFVEVVTNSPRSQEDFSVPQDDVFKSVDFKQGQDFALDCLKKFRQKVNMDKFSARKPFFMVCSFGRACFRLDVHTVAIALQACFGGLASLYNVKHLRDRSFRFSVSSSSVGFQIYNLGSQVQTSFKIFFHLWGQGGPNWIAEERKFYKEQLEEWTEVKSNFQNRKSVFSRLSYAQKVAENNHRVSAFDRLAYATATSTVFMPPRQSNEVIKDSYGNFNAPFTPGQRYNRSLPNQKTSFNFGANLPGFLSSFKFPSFPSLAWPDKTYLS